MKFLCICISFIFTSMLYAQTNEVDSLLQLYKESPNDSVRMKMGLLVAKKVADYDIITAKEYYDEVFLLAEKVDNKDITMQCYLSLATVYGMKGKYDSLRLCSYKALNLAKELNDSVAISSILGNLGAVSVKEGEYNLGIELHFEALSFATIIENKITRYNNISQCYAHLIEFDSVRKYSELAVKLCEQYSLKSSSYCIAISSIGVFFEKKERYDSSRFYTMRALKIAREINSLYLESTLLHNLGVFYELEKKYKEAIPVLENALQVSVQCNNMEITGLANLDIAKCYQEQGYFFNAKKHYLVGIDILERLKSLSSLKNPYHNLYLINKEEKKYKEALFWYEKHKAINDTLLTREIKGLSKFKEKNITLRASLQQQELEEKNQLEKNKNEEYRRLMVLGAILLIFLLGTIYFFNDARIKARANLDTIAVLNQEIRHRVKNTLQSLISVITVERFKLEEKPSISNEEVLMNVESYVVSVIGFYDLLENETLLGISAKSFFKKVEESYQMIASTIVLGVQIKIIPSDVFYKRKALEYLSQLLVELMNNSCKHAFGGIENPRIVIEFTQEENNTLVHISDNGIGMKKTSSETSQGIDITKNLVRLLKGEITMVPSDCGTTYKLNIPNKSILA